MRLIPCVVALLAISAPIIHAENLIPGTYPLPWVVLDYDKGGELTRGTEVELSKMTADEKQRFTGLVSANCLWGKNESHQIILDESMGTGKGYDVAYVFLSKAATGLSDAKRIPLIHDSNPRSKYKLHSDYKHPMMIDVNLGAGESKITEKAALDVNIVPNDPIDGCWVVVRGLRKGELPTDNGKATITLLDMNGSGVTGDAVTMEVHGESEPVSDGAILGDWNLRDLNPSPGGAFFELQQSTTCLFYAGKTYQAEISKSGDKITISDYPGPKGTVHLQAKNGNGKPAECAVLAVSSKDFDRLMLAGQSDWELPIGTYNINVCWINLGQMKIGSLTSHINVCCDRSITIENGKTASIPVGGPVSLKILNNEASLTVKRGKTADIICDIAINKDQPVTTLGYQYVMLNIVDSKGKSVFTGKCGQQETEMWGQRILPIPKTWAPGKYTIYATLDLSPYQSLIKARATLTVK